jgi:hypothetical protein
MGLRWLALREPSSRCDARATWPEHQGSSPPEIVPRSGTGPVVGALCENLAVIRIRSVHSCAIVEDIVIGTAIVQARVPPWWGAIAYRVGADSFPPRRSFWSARSTRSAAVPTRGSASPGSPSQCCRRPSTSAICPRSRPSPPPARYERLQSSPDDRGLLTTPGSQAAIRVMLGRLGPS